MGFFNKIMDVAGFNDQDQNERDYEYQSGAAYDYDEPVEERKERKERKFLPLARFNENDQYIANEYEGMDEEMRIVLLQPMRFEEAQTIARYLLDDKVVVFDLQECDVDEAVNIVNFVSGAVYALDGSIQKINDRGAIFVAVPPSVGMDNELRTGFHDGDYGPTIADWVNRTRSKSDI